MEKPAHRRMPARETTLLIAASSSVCEQVAVLGRAISATSYPGQGPSARLTASRTTRRERFRSTAFPSFLPAIKATRPEGPRPSGVCAISAMSSG